MSTLSGIALALATSLLKKFEGFITKAVWDVNAYRVGYGSDTITLLNGKTIPVTKDTIITQADADRDLQRRIQQFALHASNQVSADIWNKLPDPAKAALVSVTYNYGSLPSSVVKAIETLNINSIADSILVLQTQNHGINAHRRIQESQIIRQCNNYS